MEKLYFVTSNKGKILSAQDIFKKYEKELEWFDHDCCEPEINDIEYISKHKVIEAFNLLQKPCFVVDSGFYIDAYPGEPGFPGAFPKRAIVNKGIETVLDKMAHVENRNCRFVDCLTYYDGVEFKTFFGESHGQLAYDKKGNKQEYAKSDLWYIFIPNNHQKTLAEMTQEERENRNDDRSCAIEEFINWHNNIKIKCK